MRLVGYGDLLILNHSDSYRSSRWVSSPGGTIMSMAWKGYDLIVADHAGTIWRISPDESTETVSTVPRTPISLGLADDDLFVLTGGDESTLWRIPPETHDGPAEVALGDVRGLNSVAWIGSAIYLTDFQGGRLLRYDKTGLTQVAAGLSSPGALVTGTDGAIYVAEFGRGAIRRVMP